MSKLKGRPDICECGGSNAESVRKPGLHEEKPTIQLMPFFVRQTGFSILVECTATERSARKN